MNQNCFLDFIHFPQDSRCCRKIVLCDMETGRQYTDQMELYILELKKLPPEDQNEEGIIRWMRFLGGKSRKEFEDMAKKDEYIGETYDELERLSLDEQKRMEYELRQKAVRDYNSQIKSAEKRGIERGRHDAMKHVVEYMLKDGKTESEISSLIGCDLDEVMKLAGK